MSRGVAAREAESPKSLKPFRLTQDLALSASRETRAALASVQTLMIKGTVNDQACDDKFCYTPKSIPVSYTLSVRQLSRHMAS